MSSEPLQLDQDDYAALYAGDAYFSDIRVLNQRKGVTESDIDTALSTLLDQGGKIGAVVIVLIPELKPEPSQSPGARYSVRLSAQVIVQPLLAEDPTTGVGKTAEQIAERMRQIGHFRSFGRPNMFMFDGMEPIVAEAGKNSYGVVFKRLGGDAVVGKVAAPGISKADAIAPALGWDVTLNVPAGSTCYYTTDGSLPTAINGTEYAAPFNVPAACTVRAAAVQTGFQQSEPATLKLS